MPSVLERLRRKLWPDEQQRALRTWYSERTDLDMSEFDLGPNDTAAEIGGYHGQWASDMFARFQCRVVTTEPVASHAEVMRRRFAGNPKIEVQQIGVGARSRDETIFVSGVGSSTVNRRGGARAEKAKIVDVAEWLPSIGADPAVLMINCEGGEYEILPRIVALGLAHRFGSLLIQFHPVGTDFKAKRDAIRSALAATHREIFCYPFVWERWDIIGR